MSDRYSTITREVPVDRPRNTIFVPGATYDPAANFTDPNAKPSGELNSQHRVSLHPAGFRVRERGAIDETVVHAYRCPVHGDFDARVPRSEVPDVMPCPEFSKGYARHEHWTADDGVGVVTRRVEGGSMPCRERSPWAGSSCGIGHSAGEVTS